MPLTLLLGGAHSGKSALAVRLGTQHAGAVVFVAGRGIELRHSASYFPGDDQP